MCTYHEIKNKVLSLPPDEQLQLISEVLSVVRHRVTPKPKQPKRSILELRGLGKEIWDGVDAQEYVNQERASWNA